MVIPVVASVGYPVHHIVVWAEVEIDTVAHLPDTYQALVGEIDIPDRKIGMLDLAAGIAAEMEVDFVADIAEEGVDLSRSQNLKVH